MPSSNGHQRCGSASVHAVAVAAQVELVDDPLVEQPDDVGARADHVPSVVERALERAGAAELVARLEHEHRPAGPGEVGGGGEPVVAAADDDGVPRRGGEGAVTATLAGGHRMAALAAPLPMESIEQRAVKRSASSGGQRRRHQRADASVPVDWGQYRGTRRDRREPEADASARSVCDSTRVESRGAGHGDEVAIVETAQSRSTSAAPPSHLASCELPLEVGHLGHVISPDDTRAGPRSSSC